ncbi:Serpentine receptor class epsilon-13 [Caenorhabditis elegans]|uniref:Serpentine receptor class epsilon-13 n=1 Tax=Caenorhabditis elegans TaxID=6239 RepID=SRE13_CAEEL|nr:Serpentine receptor class epsilon-13 [Caenorhabditis elegans]O45300.2 RecName: Full=Serpentine receptor class epsilon-13; Short=Protein sre-13 [Caenorhabditis elegans]CAB07564.2 Serpentine receptor class epsilon-13 [Caenorhabditis elegans]|eukprot:NP_497042.2 Serpentine receptor class epsilon-13 [Caenorhabditis elegans]
MSFNISQENEFQTMYIKYFNKTYSIIEGSYNYYLFVFYIQIALIFIVLFYYLLNVYIDIKTCQFSTNTQKIHHAIYLPCVLGHVMCLIQKILLIKDSPAGDDMTNPVFYYISLFRAIFCFPGFYCLSAFVAERWFATYFLNDYEKNQRTWLVGLILWIIYSIAFISALDFHTAPSTVIHVTIFILLSCLAYLSNYLNFLLNRSYYYKSNRSDGGGYSLAQRFQISDNIRFSFFFNRLALSIAFFQISGPMCLLIDNLNISRSWKNLNTVVFDTILLLYAIVTPFVIYHHNPKYRTELQKIANSIRNIRVRTNKNQIMPMDSLDESFNSLRIQDTFGKTIVFNVTEQTSTYFEKLDRAWS